MKNLLHIIIIFLILYLIYLEYCSKEEEKIKKTKLKYSNSELYKILNSFSDEDKILLQEYILNLIGDYKNSKTKYKQRIYGTIIDGIIFGVIFIGLENLFDSNRPDDKVLFPLTQTLTTVSKGVIPK